MADDAKRWWGPLLALGPLVFTCGAVVGGIALYRVAHNAGFDGREVVGQAGVDYILASGLSLLAPWLTVSAALLAVVWALVARRGSVGHTFDFPSWFSIVVVILTVVVSAYTWFHPREPKLSRIVLSTAGRFCARVVLSTPDRLYLNIVTRGSREPKGTVSANSFPSDKIVVVSSPPKTRCGPVMVDKLGG